MKKTALLFPGQGSQYVGMGRDLYARFPEARHTFEEAGDTLGIDLKKLCFEGSLEELTKTENTQPAILTASVAAFQVYLKEIGIEPLYLAGHSLGEFSALTCAGGISFADALRIVKSRGRFMQEAVASGEGAMAAVTGVAAEIVEKECEAYVSPDHLVVVSNYNAPDQVVVSGHQLAINSLGERLVALGAGVTPLLVSAPFHSPLMKPAAEKLEEELGKYTFHPLKWTVVSNVTATPYPDAGKIKAYLSGQIVKPVLWQATMEFLRKQELDAALEVGPQTVLRNLMKKNIEGMAVFSMDREDDMKAFRQLVSKTDVLPAPLYLLTRCRAIAVCTRNRNWNNEEYQKGVVEPYRRIKELEEMLEREGRLPTLEQMNDALQMLRSVFMTKMTPVDEQIERFNQVFDETGTRHLFPDFKMPG